MFALLSKMRHYNKTKLLNHRFTMQEKYFTFCLVRQGVAVVINGQRFKKIFY